MLDLEKIHLIERKGHGSFEPKNTRMTEIYHDISDGKGVIMNQAKCLQKLSN
jgi:hypothetical protein